MNLFSIQMYSSFRSLSNDRIKIKELPSSCPIRLNRLPGLAKELINNDERLGKKIYEYCFSLIIKHLTVGMCNISCEVIMKGMYDGKCVSIKHVGGLCMSLNPA